MFKLAHHINGSAWLNLSHHIFSNHLSFFPYIESAFYICYLRLLYITEWKFNIFEKQLGVYWPEKIKSNTKQISQDTHIPTPRLQLPCKRRNSRSHSNNGKNSNMSHSIKFILFHFRNHVYLTRNDLTIYTQ